MAPNAQTKEILPVNSEVHVSPAVDEVAEVQRLISNLDISDQERTNLLDAITAQRNFDYEGVLELPWTVVRPENEDVERAKRSFDSLISCMDVVRERVVAYMEKRKADASATPPVLVLNGPSGIGKTTAAEAIAKALDRSFQWVSVDWMVNAMDVQGSANTMGGIMKAVRRSKCCNPLILIDDLDEKAEDASIVKALKTVLDPMTNRAFVDKSVGVPFDLSNVFFVVTTSNRSFASLPNVEVIDLHPAEGYCTFDKMVVMKNHLIAQEAENYGLKAVEFAVDDVVAENIVDDYNTELGVHGLKRTVGSLIRAVALKYIEDEVKPKSFTFDQTFVESTLGARSSKHYTTDHLRKELPYGISFLMTGQSSSAELGAIETLPSYRKEGVLVTGEVSDDVSGAVKTVHAHLKERMEDYGISEAFTKSEIHVHFPQYSVKEAGKDVGCAAVLALVSLTEKRRIRVDSVADGVVDKAGKVTKAAKIGHKVYAAYKEGFKRFVLPKENKADVEKLHAQLQTKLEFVYVESVQELLDDMLEAKKQ